MTRFEDVLKKMDIRKLTSCAQNLLGDLKPGLKKQDLVPAICRWFEDEDNILWLTASLDSFDIRMVSLAIAMGRLDMEKACRALPSVPAPALQACMDSLCNRLVLVEDSLSLCLNPAIKARLESECFNSRSLGETAVSFSQPRTSSFKAGREFIRATLNLMIAGVFPCREANRHHFYKGTSLRTCFPACDKDVASSLFRMVSSFITANGYVTIRNNRFHIRREAARTLLEMTPEQLLLSCAEHFMGRNGAQAASRLLTLCRAVPMSEEFFQRAAEIACIGNDCAGCEDGIIDTLIGFGAVTLSEGEVHANKDFFQPYAEMTDVTVDSDMMVSYRGTAGSDDILYLLADLVSCDTLVQYRLTKDSYFRARNEGITPEEIRKYLNESDLDDTLGIFEAAYSRVRIYEGTVIRSSEDSARIIENHPSLSRHIIERIAPCVYLMDETSRDEWEKDLSWALDMKSLPSSIQSGNPDQGKGFTPAAQPSEEIVLGYCENSTDSVKKLLDDASSKGILTDAVRLFIESKVIIAPSQLSRAFTYVGGSTAGGLSYSAKEGLFRSALKSKGTLLLVELTDESFTAVATAMDRDDDGSCFVTLTTIPDGETRRIKVGQVFRVTELRMCVR